MSDAITPEPIGQDPDLYKGNFGEGLHQALDLIVSGDPVVVSTTLRTLRLAIEATVIASAIGLPLGCLLGIGRFRGRRMLLAIANALTRTPPVVIGVIVVLLVTEESLWGGGPLAGLHMYSSNPYNITYFAQTLLAIPIIVALTATAVQGITPGLLEQARALGAPGWRRGVLALREARIAVLAGVLVAMGVTITAIGAIIVARGPLLSADNEPATLAVGALTSFTSSGGNYNQRPQAIAYATILLGLFFLIAAALTRLQQHRTWIAGRQS